MIATLPPSAVHAAPFVPVTAIGDTIPDLPLVDENDRRLSLYGGARPTVVSFAYTRCPDPEMCSLVTTKFGILQRLLAGTGIRLLEISLDPAFDRPAVLRRYAAAVGARSEAWSFATGRPDDVFALAARFGIVFAGPRKGAFGHTDLVAIVAPDGTLVDRIDGARWAPSDVAAQARADAGLPSNPLMRGALRLFASAGAMCAGRGGGLTLAAALAVFVALATTFACVAVRLSTTKHPERSRS